MAATNGFKTSIRIGSSAIVLMDGWNMTINQGVAEYSSFGTTFANAFPNVKRWMGTCKGTLDRSATGQSALLDQLESAGTVADVALRFYTSTGNAPYWSGNGVLESAGIDSAVEDKVSVNFSFKGNGSIAYTSST